MTSRALMIAGCLAAALLIMTQSAEAQGRGRYSSGYSPPSINPTQNLLNRPTVSPYLNLLQGGPGNYQSFVRPFAQGQQQMRQQQGQIGNLQRGLNQVQNSLNAPTSSATGGLRPTGHQIFYRNFSHYYPNAR